MTLRGAVAAQGTFNRSGRHEGQPPSSFKSSALATAPLAVLLAHIWTLSVLSGVFCFWVKELSNRD